jgi:hypothetical protein
MKKIMVILISLALITTASALTITAPETVEQGSTAIFTLQGNILEPITKSDIGFFEQHVQIPFDYDIEKIENIYYIYALIPYEEKSYSLRINDIYFKENNEFKTLNLEANFSTSDAIAEFNVNPGFKLLSGNSFQVQIYNNLNSDLPITYTIAGTEKQTTLPLQESKTLTIDVEDIEGTSLNTLTIASATSQFEMPVYVIRTEFAEPTPDPIVDENNITIEPEVIPKSSKLQFSANTIDETLKTGEVRKITLGIINNGDESTGKINLEVSDEIKDLIDLETTSISDLSPGEEAEIIFSIKAETSGEFEGGIQADSQKSLTELRILLLIDEDITPVTSIRSETTCADLDGEVCLKSQFCSGVSLPVSSNGLCCTEGTCTSDTETPEDPKKSSTVSIIVVAIALLIILVIIGLKLKKSRKPKPKRESARPSPPRKPPLPPPLPDKPFPAKNVQVR